MIIPNVRDMQYVDLVSRDHNICPLNRVTLLHCDLDFNLPISIRETA